jgi:biopolymer transport protein ExbD
MSSSNVAADVVEPNLTSLLDLVMQLLMFFIMCVNFVANQSAAEISLPDSQAAAPLDDQNADALFLNIRPFHAQDPVLVNKYSENPGELEKLGQKFRPGQVYISILGQEPMALGALRIWLRDQYQRQVLEKNGKVNTAIIIRAHRETDYKDVYDVMELCRAQGYTQLIVRVLKV